MMFTTICFLVRMLISFPSGQMLMLKRLMVSSQKPLPPSVLNCHKYVHEIILLDPNAQQHRGLGRS